MIDISKRDKAEVLAVLYNNSKVQGMGFLHATPEAMTKEEAKELLEDGRERKYFDYLKGRVMKIDLTGEQLDPCLYDRDNGQGAAERAISTIK